MRFEEAGPTTSTWCETFRRTQAITINKSSLPGFVKICQALCDLTTAWQLLVPAESVIVESAMVEPHELPNVSILVLTFGDVAELSKKLK